MSRAHRLSAVILARDANQNVYCEAHTAEVDMMTVDHVMPRAVVTRGLAADDDEPSNLVAACGRCNSMKRDLTLPVFALYLMESHGWTVPQALAMMERVRAATTRKVSK